MSQFTGAAATATEQAGVYTAALLDTLGSRDPFEVLRATPGAIRQTLSECSAAELAEPERPGKWSMHQLVQHLADSELVGAFRFRMILAHDRPPSRRTIRISGPTAWGMRKATCAAPSSSSPSFAPPTSGCSSAPRRPSASGSASTWSGATRASRT